MKMKSLKSNVAALFAVGCAFFVLTSCAEMESSNTKSLLSSAGFQVRTPSNAQQKELYAALPANKVERATVKGKVFYVFKDEKAGIAYVGHEAEYQRYKQLAIQQRVAQDYYTAIEMDRMNAYRWSGAWGVHGMYW